MNKEEVKKFVTGIIKSDRDFVMPNNDEEKKPERKSKGYAYIITAKNILRSAFDILLLMRKLRKTEFLNDHTAIAYINMGFVIKREDGYKDRIYKEVIDKTNIIYIAYSKYELINKIDKKKVYNIGPFISFLYKINTEKDKELKYFFEFQRLNAFLLKKLNCPEVYIPCYYDTNGLSLIFNKYRDNYKLIEVQHGSIVNYPTYSFQSDYKLVDVVYVRNQRTIDYLNENLYAKHKTKFRMIKKAQNEELHFKPGLNILYASSIEIKGLHKTFIEFLQNTNLQNVFIKVRLHPRELDRKPEFEKGLQSLNCTYEFDTSDNWLAGNTIKNLVIVSPWSSMIEEAVDNGFTTFIIDETGKERYEALIDNKHCFFTSDIDKTLKSINLNGE